MKQISDSSFAQDVLGNNTLTVVDFWAEWCGPCRQLAPILDEAAAELVGKAEIVKLNVDENPNTPAQYGVRGIPTLMAFKGGEMIGSKTGNMTKAKLLEWLNSIA